MRKQLIPWRRVFEKYRKLMNYKSALPAFTKVVSLHINEDHKTTYSVIHSDLAKSAATVDAFAQRMLELGTEKLSKMEAKDITFNDVINSQRMLQESKKLKMTEDAMLIMMRKMFAPPNVNFIEGEVE